MSSPLHDLERRAAELYSCPDCGAILDHPAAACDRCDFDPDPGLQVDGPDAGDLADARDREHEHAVALATGGALLVGAVLIVFALAGDAVALDRAINEAKAEARAALWGDR